MLYVIEGTDAAGKRTQAQRLADRLGCQLLGFPAYHTITGQAISAHLKEQWAVQDEGLIPHGVPNLNALVRQSLFMSNRLEFFGELSAASGSPTHHLVLDRYWASGLVYGRVDGLDKDWLDLIHRSLPKGDRWVLLDIPVAEGFRRRPERRDALEADETVLTKAREEYLRVWLERGWAIVDGMGSVDEVAERVAEACGLPPASAR